MNDHTILELLFWNVAILDIFAFTAFALYSIGYLYGWLEYRRTK